MNGRAVGLALCALLLWSPIVTAQSIDPGQPDAPNGDTAFELVEPQSPASPDAVTLSSTTPYCAQIDAARNACTINWRQILATAGVDASMRVVTVTLGSRIRAVYRGFFQSSIDVVYGMNGPGFGVPCGAFGQSGDPAMGRAYTFAVEALDSAGSWARHTGSVTCPGVRLVLLPFVLRH